MVASAAAPPGARQCPTSFADAPGSSSPSPRRRRGAARRPRAALPMDLVIAKELEIAGGHGMPVGDYAALLDLVAAGRLDPGRLVSDVVGLAEGAALLTRFDTFPNRGMTLIDLARG